MELTEAKEKFIQTWGALGSNWGINKTKAQVHAFLLIAEHPVSAEYIMEGLQISRGNANMNIRALIDWGLVYKEHQPGERREFFIAEKDMYKVAKQIIKIRRQREIEPVVKLLGELQDIDNKDTDAAAHFVHMIKDIKDITQHADSLAGRLIDADQNWFTKTLLKLIR